VDQFVPFGQLMEGTQNKAVHTKTNIPQGGHIEISKIVQSAILVLQDETNQQNRRIISAKRHDSKIIKNIYVALTAS
jgi:hypothetical protein